MSHQNVFKNVTSKSPIKLSHQNDPLKHNIKTSQHMFHENIMSKYSIKCPIKMSHQNVTSKCPNKMSH